MPNYNNLGGGKKRSKNRGRGKPVDEDAIFADIMSMQAAGMRGNVSFVS